MTIHDYVHCHICPLKEICKFAETEDCYIRSKNMYSNAYGMDYDLTKIWMATVNCPLRKLFEKGEKHT